MMREENERNVFSVRSGSVFEHIPIRSIRANGAAVREEILLSRGVETEPIALLPARSILACTRTYG